MMCNQYHIIYQYQFKMNKSMYIIGIDPGLASLGWGILRASHTTNAKGLFEKQSIEHVAHGVIETYAKDSLGMRLLHIEQSIDAIFARYDISVLSYEQQFFVKNVTSGLQVAHALGVILLYAAKQGLEVVSFVPKAIKLQMTGSASAKKESVQKFVSMHLGLDEVKIHHAADALGVALCYCYKHQNALTSKSV